MKFQNKFIMANFIKLLVKERLKENFYYLYFDEYRIVMITKTVVHKVKIDNIDPNSNNEKNYENKSLILYIIQLNETKDCLGIELSLEPVSGFYPFYFDNEIKLVDERNFFSSLANYYKILDKNIENTVINKFYMIKDTIYKKLDSRKLTKASNFSIVKKQKAKKHPTYKKELKIIT